jgi:hypothetical protein
VVILRVRAKVKVKSKEKVRNSKNEYCIITHDMVVLIIIGTIT